MKIPMLKPFLRKEAYIERLDPMPPTLNGKEGQGQPGANRKAVAITILIVLASVIFSMLTSRLSIEDPFGASTDPNSRRLTGTSINLTNAAVFQAITATMSAKTKQAGVQVTATP